MFWIQKIIRIFSSHQKSSKCRNFFPQFNEHAKRVLRHRCVPSQSIPGAIAQSIRKIIRGQISDLKSKLWSLAKRSESKFWSLKHKLFSTNFSFHYLCVKIHLYAKTNYLNTKNLQHIIYVYKNIYVTLFVIYASQYRVYITIRSKW